MLSMTSLMEMFSNVFVRLTARVYKQIGGEPALSHKKKSIPCLILAGHLFLTDPFGGGSSSSASNSSSSTGSVLATAASTQGAVLGLAATGDAIVIFGFALLGLIFLLLGF